MCVVWVFTATIKFKKKNTHTHKIQSFESFKVSILLNLFTFKNCKILDQDSSNLFIIIFDQFVTSLNIQDG